MTFAAVIGSWAMPHFVELGIAQLQKIFNTDLPIIVSDDLSDKSKTVSQLCNSRGAWYARSESRRGHFAGDCQAFVTGLVFAKQQDADFLLKLSQRFILGHPDCRPAIEKHFVNPEIAIGLPGRPDKRGIILRSERSFSKFACLTDFAVLRVREFIPEDIKNEYESIWAKQASTSHQMRRQQVGATLIEGFWDRLRHAKYANRSVIMPEFTNHVQGKPHLFLRRYQNHPAEYAHLAALHGIKAPQWRTDSFARLFPGYDPIPRAGSV